jgi:GTP pyrophosphokinase
MRRLLEPPAETAGEAGQPALADALGAELAEERIYTLTPKGEVIDLPRGGTVLDFAYHVHTMVGHRTRGAKVNGRIVPLDHVLSSGDRVEILVGKTGEPRRDWLLPSNRFPGQRTFARQGPRLVPQAGPRPQRAGRARGAGPRTQAPGAAARRPGRGGEEIPRRQRRRLYVQVALGDVGPSQVGRALHEEQRAATEPAAPQPRRPIKGAAPPPSRSSPCRASATSWCSWRAAASRWPASPSPAI